MVKNIENKFWFDVDGDRITANRLLVDEYDRAEALRLVDDTIEYFIAMKDFIDNSEDRITAQINSYVRDNPEVSRAELDKIKQGLERKVKIDRDVEMPKMVKELKEYLRLADILGYVIDIDNRAIIEEAINGNS